MVEFRPIFTENDALNRVQLELQKLFILVNNELETLKAEVSSLKESIKELEGNS